jgi:hypothetical protein
MPRFPMVVASHRFSRSRLFVMAALDTLLYGFARVDQPGLLQRSFDVGMRGRIEMRIHFVSGDIRNQEFFLSVSLLKIVQIAPGIGVVMTSDETRASYGVNGFPVVAIVDKLGRLRYVGRDTNFEDDDSVGLLIHKLIEE